MYSGSPSEFANTLSTIPIFYPEPLLVAATLALLTLVCTCITASGISYSFRAGQVEGRLVVPKRAESPARFGGSPRPRVDALCRRQSQALCE